jgi:hypothetical protein
MALVLVQLLLPQFSLSYDRRFDTYLRHGIGSCTAIIPSVQVILRPTIRHLFTPWHWFLYSYYSLSSGYLKTDDSTLIYTMALVLVQLTEGTIAVQEPMPWCK